MTRSRNRAAAQFREKSWREIEHGGEEVKSRTWIHLVGDGNKAKGAYHRIDRVLEDGELMKRMIAQAKEDLEAFERRYQHVLALRKNGVLHLVREAVEKLTEGEA